MRLVTDLTTGFQLAPLGLPGLVDISITAYRLLSIWLFSFLNRLSSARVAMNTDANPSLSYSANNGDDVLAFRACIFALIESLC